jgi:tetratricopeptide (TPR) repeat protein
MSHPDTCSAAAHLATTCCEQGRWKEAETLQWEALQQRRGIFGREHPRTIALAENLVATYSEQEKWEEAIGLQVELLEVKRRLLGDEDPRTMGAAAALASTYHSQGRLDEAEELKLELLHQRRIILGANHPYTILALDSLIATRRLREESKFVRKLISAIMEGKFKRNRDLLVDIAEEPRLWYYETFPFLNATGKGAIAHKGVVTPCVPLTFLNNSQVTRIVCHWWL